jgi:16S rRNA (cytosine967-C5)-methyltransferase
VSATVAAAKADKASRPFAGLINAVLRKLTTDEASSTWQTVSPAPLIPDWIRARWQASYGAQRVARMLTLMGTPPPLDVTLKPAENPEVWAKRLGAHVTPTGSLRLSAMQEVRDLPGFHCGTWWVQDAAAAIPARLAGAKAGERVLDLCAAPGGKTLQLAATGASVTAVDVSAERLTQISENLKRTRLSADLVTADGRKLPFAPVFDAVLIDAPCTATGTIRRRPDVAFTRRESDVSQLARLQDALVDDAVRVLRPGGRLIYCTCSLEPEEGEIRAQAALARHKALRLNPVTPDEVAGLETGVHADGTWRVTPEMAEGWGGVDGFFAARFTKA